MEFGILGPIEARLDGSVVPLGGPKQRALVAVLLLARGRFVSRDRLIDALWGERPPATAPHTLDAYISRVRKLFGGDRVSRGSGGYALHVTPGELDLERFEGLVAEGRALLAGGRAEDAGERLRTALELWRGPALADVLNEPFAATEAAILEELRLAALEDRIDADLARGSHADVVGELESLIREQPFRERLLGQLMTALYRSGQQARALDAYRAGRQRAAEELGLEPGPALRELERRILAHDPALGVPAPAPRNAPRSGRVRVGVAAAAVAVVAAAASVAVVVLRGSSGAEASTGGNGLVELRRGSAELRLPTAPAALAAGFGSLWIAEPGRADVARVDPGRSAVVDRIPVGGTPAVVTTGGGSVWVAGVPGDRVSRIDPETGTVTQRIGLGGGEVGALAFGGGALWVADATDDSLLEVDPGSGAVRQTVTLAFAPTALAVTPRGIWVVDYDDGTVSEVDPRGGSVLATTRVGTGPSAIAASGDAVWIANELDGTVSRIDASSATVVSTVPVESGPASIIALGRTVWVANLYAGSVSRVVSGGVVGTTAVGAAPTALAALGKRIWVSTRSLAQHRGGTVTVLHTRPITIDPALQQDLLPLVSDGLTRDELVTYDHEPGSAGTRLVPDLAENVPLPTDGGTTYTFRLRPGIHYSDGRLVRAADYRRAIARAFRLGSPARVGLNDIVGASACTTSRCDLSDGIVADETARTVSFHLRAANPDFVSNLTGAAASPVPPGTPMHPVTYTPVPGTGPYVIAEANDRRIVWVRNKRFREWSHAAQPTGNPDRIVLRFGLQPEAEVREVEANRADAIVDNVPATMLREVETRYAARLHSFVIPTTDFFQFNTKVAPFDDVRVRRAVNLAIDRRAIVRLYGGGTLATPTCQLLPPGNAGYRRFCPYRPDLARARSLVAQSGTRGDHVNVFGWTDDPTISEGVVRYVARVLTELGYRVRVRLVSHASLDHPPARVYHSIQMIPTGWGDSTYGFFATWYACGAAGDHGWFCDAQLDRANARARGLQATNPQEAASIWAGIDRGLVDRAVALPMVNERGIDFLSNRVTNYEAHPYLGLILDQLVVRR